MGTAEKLITENLDVWSSAIKKKSSTGRGSAKKIELYGISKLRGLIYDLAMRGLLVPQETNDESAMVLLEKIATEKSKLIENKQIKKSALLPKITNEEELYPLPSGWEWARLGELSANIHYGYTASALPENAGVRLLRITDIQNDRVNWSTVPGCEISEDKSRGYLLENNDILIARTGGTIGKSYLVENIKVKAVFASYLIRVTRISEMYSAFVKTYLGSGIYWNQLYDNASGTGQPNVNATALKSLLVPIAPLEEQHRIVAKVDELMALCDHLEQQQESSISAHELLVETLLAALTNAADKGEFNQAWERIAEHFDTLFTTEHSVDQLKQTILQLAVMGKLVPQNPDDEPASVLLEKIAAEKEQLVKDGKIKKQKASPEIGEDEKPFDLPDGWEWVRLGDITEIRGGKRVANGYKLLNSPTDHVYIRVKDMRNGTIDDSDLHYIDDTMFEKISRYIISKDDIYMTIVGATIGKCGLVPERFDQMNLTENAARLIPWKGVGKVYLYKCLDSVFCQRQFLDKTKQVGVQKMALNRLSSTFVPLPPLEEQKRVVTKFDAIGAICDELKARIVETQVTQSRLADAMVDEGVG